MLSVSVSERRCLVALLAEGVDRNQKVAPVAGALGYVALLAEGVDRNWAFRAVAA